MVNPGMQSTTHLITGEANGFPRPFGNYLLLAAFAQGGMGELFLAMNGSIAGALRLCVVKKLRADLTNDKEYVNRFIDEARVIVQLNHANISHVFDVGRIEGQYYLAMEYVSGISVKKLMSRAAELETVIPEDIAIHISRGVLEALDYAHQHTHPITGEVLNVVHRDVSPQNMMVTWAGEVKLIDFGLALSALKDEHTATGAVMGKVAYMPPEQARGDDVGPSCDQFSTAVCLYEMLVGDRYHGDLPLHAIWAIAGMGNFPPPRWNKLTPELQNVLGKALQNDPFRRYGTCGDLREALGAYMAQRRATSSERSLRDLLDKWFKDYRASERELLAQFKDVTGKKIREAVMATQTNAESLLSGPHSRPEPAWQMPARNPTPSPILSPTALPSAPPLAAPSHLTMSPMAQQLQSASVPQSPSLPPPQQAGQKPMPSAEQDWRAMISKSMPIAPAPSGSNPMMPLPDARLDESRSLRLMPPPAGSSIAPTDPGALGNAAAALLASPVARGPALDPLAAMPARPSTVGESTEQFMRSAGTGGAAAIATLTPRATVAESTEKFLRDQAAKAQAQVLAELAQQRATTTAPTISRAIDRHEPTERVNRGVQGTVARPAVDDVDALAFGPKRNLWPLAAAAAGLVAVVAVVIAIASSSSTPPAANNTPTPPPVTTPTPPPVTATPDVDTNAKPATPTTATPPPTHVAHNNTSKPSHTHETASTPEKTPTPDKPAAPVESEAAKRARDHVATLKRSGCNDPCVQSVVGQLETTPAAVEIDGFRNSVDSCVEACRTH
jgi:serine/threonine protein kinase